MRRIQDKILAKLKLVRISEKKAVEDKLVEGITLDKMELEKRFNIILKEKDRRINLIKDQIASLQNENEALRNKIKDYPAFLKELKPAQINALYYEMITTVRSTPNMRHLFGIWFKRMINAIETMDSELMQLILEDNSLHNIVKNVNNEKFSEKTM